MHRRLRALLELALGPRAALFGSYVRGEAGEDSDIDILVDLLDDQSLLDLIKLKFRRQETFRRKVDILTYDSIHPLLKPYIEREQFLIL